MENDGSVKLDSNIILKFDFDLYAPQDSAFPDIMENAYLKELKDMSGLKILQNGRVLQAYNTKKKLGLFMLFFTRQ